MDKNYFETYAKDDYIKALETFGKIVISNNDLFKAQAGEIKLNIYVSRLKKVYNLKTMGEALNKWMELAGLESIEIMKMQTYFEKNAEYDYHKALEKFGEVTCSKNELFQSSKGKIR
jgi:hypothetical protein